MSSFNCSVESCTTVEENLQKLETHLYSEHGIKKDLQMCPDCQGNSQSCYICDGRGYRDSGRI